MTVMEDIQNNISNNRLFILINSENKVVNTSEITMTDPEWIEIDWEYDNVLNPIDTNPWLYNSAGNSVTQVAPDYFQIDREASIKKQKIEDVAALTVTTTSGKVFDGDEASQDRMLRAIRIAEIAQETTTEWKMADNSLIVITLDELKEALVLAGKAMRTIWLVQ